MLTWRTVNAALPSVPALAAPIGTTLVSEEAALEVPAMRGVELLAVEALFKNLASLRPGLLSARTRW